MKPAPHDELRGCFTQAGYDRVTPVRSTGNVVFASGRNHETPDEDALSDMIERYFGHPLPRIVRTGADV